MIVDDRVDEFELLPCATPNPHPARAIYGFVFSNFFFFALLPCKACIAVYFIQEVKNFQKQNKRIGCC